MMRILSYTNKIKTHLMNWLRGLSVIRGQRVMVFVCLTMNADSTCAEIYRWQQKDGTHRFTDQPTHGAQKIQLPTPIIIQSDNLHSQFSEQNIKHARVSKYQSVQIESPTNDSIIRENSGNVPLNVAIVPDLVEQFNDQIVFILNHHEVARGQARRITLRNMDRGTHEIQVIIEDEQGNALIQSNMQKFHLLRYRLGQ